MKFAHWFLLFYAVAIIGGGVMGYVSAQSMASLIAGSVFGLLLVLALVLSMRNPTTGFVFGGVVALMLLAFFGYRYYETGKFMPAGMTIILSLIAAVILFSSARQK